MLRRIGLTCLVLSILLLAILLSPGRKVDALTPTLSATACGASLTITGQVYDISTMQGIAGATVIANTSVSHPFSTTTAADGTYSLSIPTTSNYACLVTGLVVNASGYHQYSVSATSSQLRAQPVRNVGMALLSVVVTPSSTATIGCGSVVVVTSTSTPTSLAATITATKTFTRTPTLFVLPCGPTVITATPNIATLTPTRTPTGGTGNGPDLVISSITAGISGPACANLRHYNVVVVNNGNATAGSFVVSYSVGGVVAPDQTVSGLAAGASVVLNFPAASGAGMNAIATADSTNVIAEGNESNNSLSATLPVPSRAATCTPTSGIITPTPTRTPPPSTGIDLIISSILYAGSNPACANMPKDNVTVTNIGTVDAGTFLVAFSRNGIQETPQTVSGLAAGQSVTLIFTYGSSLVATADSTNLIAESNESNNSLSVTLPVPTQSPTCTPTSGTPVTRTPTPTRTRTPTPGTGACSPVNATITAPFTQDGVGSFCWQSTNLGTYINSWNMTSLTVNGVSFTNQYVGQAAFPAKINGYWYVVYNSTVPWSHFEAK